MSHTCSTQRRHCIISGLKLSPFNWAGQLQRFTTYLRGFHRSKVEVGVNFSSFKVLAKKKLSEKAEQMKRRSFWQHFPCFLSLRCGSFFTVGNSFQLLQNTHEGVLSGIWTLGICLEWKNFLTQVFYKVQKLFIKKKNIPSWEQSGDIYKNFCKWKFSSSLKN